MTNLFYRAGQNPGEATWLASYTSAGNSTTTALGASETFTGISEKSSHPDMMVTCKSDVAGTLYVDFSVDGTNWDTQIPFVVSAGSGEFHTLVKGARHCRVRYVNGSSAQSYLRLQTDFGHFRQPNQALNTAVTLDADAIATRPTQFAYEAALGRRTGVTTWNKFGYNADVDTGTEIVASWGGTHTILSAASTLTIVSSDAADDSGSTGATGIVIYGVDANWNDVIEVVTMDGTTPVVTTSTWLGINRASIYTAGTGQTNAGTITITATTGGTTQAVMPAGEGTTQQCLFFVADNKTALMDFLFLNAEKLAAGGTPKVTFKCWVYSAVSNSKYEVFRYLVDTGAGAGYLALSPNQPFIVGEKSVFWITATTDSDNTTVNARFSLVTVEA